MVSAMVPFQSAFLGKQTVESAVKNDAAKRLERRLHRHRKNRSRRAAAGVETAQDSCQPSIRGRPVADASTESQALRTCSHSDINTGSGQIDVAAEALEGPCDAIAMAAFVKRHSQAESATALSEEAKEGMLPQQEGPEVTEQLMTTQMCDAHADTRTNAATTEPAVAAVTTNGNHDSEADADALVLDKSDGALRRRPPSSDLQQSEVTQQLAKRGKQLCARMNALAATLHSRPLVHHMASRSRSVPPLGSSTSDAVAPGTGKATAPIRSRMASELVPLRNLQPQQHRGLPEIFARDHRPRRATVPVTGGRSGDSVREDGGYRCRHQLAPLDSKVKLKGHRLGPQQLLQRSEPSGKALGPPFYIRRR